MSTFRELTLKGMRRGQFIIKNTKRADRIDAYLNQFCNHYHSDASYRKWVQTQLTKKTTTYTKSDFMTMIFRFSSEFIPEWGEFGEIGDEKEQKYKLLENNTITYGHEVLEHIIKECTLTIK